MYENKIVGTGTEHPEQLLANPNNWRIHPKTQQDALESLLDDVGWVQNIIVNQRTGHVVDGHMRAAVAISRNETEVPVVYVDLTDDEERKVLASLDPIGAMAATDKDAIIDLIASIDVSESLASMLEELTHDWKGDWEDTENSNSEGMNQSESLIKIFVEHDDYEKVMDEVKELVSRHNSARAE
tara:strand:+ start:331 stop:882 length:552 start_codon:yes stop_codon:yes gene_type:complete